MYSIIFKNLIFKEECIIESVFSKLALTQYTNEGLIDIQNDTEYISVKYYKKLLSAELVFDNTNEKIHTESLRKLLIADIQINKQNNSCVIFGNLTACQLFEEFLNINSPIRLRVKEISYQQMLSQVSGFDYVIYKLSFSNVKFLNTNLPAITLEFRNNVDAFNIVKKFNSSPTEVSIKLIFENDIVHLSVNLNTGSINITTNSIKNIYLESIKEKLINIIEE